MCCWLELLSQPENQLVLFLGSLLIRGGGLGVLLR